MIDDKRGKEHDPLHRCRVHRLSSTDLLGRSRSKSTLMVRRLCHASCSISPRCLFGLHANKHSNDLDGGGVRLPIGNWRNRVDENRKSNSRNFRSLANRALKERRLENGDLHHEITNLFLLRLDFKMNGQIDNAALNFFARFFYAINYYRYVIFPSDSLIIIRIRL